MKITNSVEKNGYPQLIQDCNASTIKEILERVLHSITRKFDCAALDIPYMTPSALIIYLFDKEMLSRVDAKTYINNLKEMVSDEEYYLAIREVE